MAQTADGIVYPVSGDQISPDPGGLASHFQDLAESVGPAIATSQGRPWRMMQKTGGSLITHNSWTAAGGWVGVEGDPGDSSGISYGSGGFTFSEPGVYSVSFQASLHGPTYDVGAKQVRLLKGQAAVARGAVMNLGGLQTMFCSYIGYMISGTVVTAEIQQTSGSSMSWQTDSGMNLLYAYQIAPDVT